MDPSEKRRYQRVAKNVNVRLLSISHKTPFSTDMWTGNSINMSASGILLKTDKQISVGETVMLKFIKPNTFEFFEGIGVVVRSEKESDNVYVHGIDFLDLKEKDYAEMDFLVQK
ncbi:MAG: PilZ domain-containing protein [Desulfobacteraceae bacterium]|nr:PilZ domain-containing protein [Desulfobacteraceae bacterium]